MNSRKFTVSSVCAKHDFFLTLTDAGLMMECPAEGKASFSPWKVIAAVVVRKGLLMAVSRQNGRNVTTSFLNIKALPLTVQKEIAAYCKEHCGKGEGVVPPPSFGGTVLTFSGTPQQSVELANYTCRPGVASFGCVLFATAVYILLLGYIGWQRLELLVIAVLFVCLDLKRALVPGLFFRRIYEGGKRVELSPRQVCFHVDNGRWSRQYRSEGDAFRWKLVRLRHSLCIEESRPGLRLVLHGMTDPGQKLPPFLESITPVPAPGRFLRTALLLLVVSLSVVGAQCFSSLRKSVDAIYYRGDILVMSTSRIDKMDDYLASLVENESCKLIPPAADESDGTPCLNTGTYEVWKFHRESYFRSNFGTDQGGSVPPALSTVAPVFYAFVYYPSVVEEDDFSYPHLLLLTPDQVAELQKRFGYPLSGESMER